jgi:small subunit ribosomal protein S19e
MQMATQRLTVRDVSGHAFIAAYAEHLKKGGKIEVPKWAEYIKTGVARELGPLADDWYFHRAGE